MEKRISVEKEELKKVYQELKARGYSIDRISDEINSEFRNHLYKGTSFTEKSFQLLESLYDDSISSSQIDYIDGRGKVEPLVIEKTKLMAELTGIILGDGHIDKHSYNRGDRYVSSHYLSITIGSSETKIINRAKFLATECLGRQFNEEKLNHADAVNLKMHGKSLVHSLNKLSLVSGNKVEKQVSVPEWIYDDLEFQKACLKGLFDTDGSYYKRSEDGYKIVYFKNMSANLLNDFVQLCDNLDIRTSEAGTNAVQVAAQKEVEKFINKVSPIKEQNVV